jgi:hypothetical protein
VCAHAVRVAVEKIPGVDSARVSLNEGYAEIALVPENGVTVERVREVIRNNGFTPKETRIRVTGVVTQRGAEPALAVRGQGVRFLLVEHPDARGRAAELAEIAPDREVTVEGVVPETAQETEGPLALEVLRFAGGERTPP